MELIKSGGYRKMHSFALVCMIYYATETFCERNLDFKKDPQGKLTAQMNGAARSARQNIVEASSRREFSRQQELMQYSVAKGSLNELAGDYEAFIFKKGEAPWRSTDESAVAVAKLKVDDFTATEEVPHEYGVYLLKMSQRFSPWLQHETPLVAAQAILLTIRRAVGMLTSQMRGMIAETATTTDSPRCPSCGSLMIKRIAKKGPRAGRQFWSCTRYPDCTGTISIQED